jgi:gas vesicle protein
MNPNAKLALEQSLKELHVPTDRLDKGKKYSIVEFCNDYLQLPLEETTVVSKELMSDMPAIYLKEDNWGDTLQRWGQSKASQYGNQIRSAAQNKFGVGSTGNAPKIQQSWSSPVKKIGQGIQDLFNTKGSALRNSPMIRVDDNAKGVTKYIAFPDLDLERPGHKRVLDTIIQGMNKDGRQAQQINVAAPERAAAQQAGNYAEISTPDSGENKKQAVEAALQQLEDLVTKNKDAVSKYSFMSAEELAELQKEIASAAGQASQTINAAQNETQEDTQEMTQEAEQAASASASAGQSQQQQAAGPNAYKQETDKILSAADIRAQQSASAPQAPQAAGQVPAPTDNVIDAEIVPPEEGRTAAPAQASAPGQMPTLSTLRNQAGDLAANATTKQGLATVPINASQAAKDNTKVALNPGQQSASLPQSGNFTFTGTPTSPAATPLAQVNPDGTGFTAEVTPGVNYNSATGKLTGPEAATGGEYPALPTKTPVSPNGPLATQLANQPQGTIEDSIAAARAATSGRQQPTKPNVVNPADPNSLAEVNPEDLPKQQLTDPVAWAHV